MCVLTHFQAVPFGENISASLIYISYSLFSTSIILYFSWGKKRNFWGCIYYGKVKFVGSILKTWGQKRNSWGPKKANHSRPGSFYSTFA